MDTKKIGELIKKIRKEKGLSQQELADKLMVSPKTVSKWECSNGLPDITLLKKLSEVLGVTIEELLEGTKNSSQKKDKNNKILIIICAISIVIISIVIFPVSKDNENTKEEYNCEVIRTLYIDNIKNSNDENYLYITVSEFQIEETYTLKLPKTISQELEEKNNYEFTFKTTDTYVSEKLDNLFNNSEIINVIATDKVGMEQSSGYICN